MMQEERPEGCPVCGEDCDLLSPCTGGCGWAICPACADVPVSILGQEKYIAEGGSQFEKLARLWECEAVQAGHRGQETISDTEGKRRWSQFWKIWERVNKPAGEPGKEKR